MTTTEITTAFAQLSLADQIAAALSIARKLGIDIEVEEAIADTVDIEIGTPRPAETPDVDPDQDLPCAMDVPVTLTICGQEVKGVAMMVREPQSDRGSDLYWGPAGHSIDSWLSDDLWLVCVVVEGVAASIAADAADELTRETGRVEDHDLRDADTGDVIRTSTVDEWRASVEAGDTDGGHGIIDVDGRRYYVD